MPSVPVEILVGEGARNCVGNLWLSSGFDANRLIQCDALYKASFYVTTLFQHAGTLGHSRREEKAKKKYK